MNSKSVFSILLLIVFFVSCKETNEELLDKACKLSREKKYDKAIEVYSQVIKSNSKLQLAYYNRGFAYLTIEQYDKALRDFNTVMDLQSIGAFVITYDKDSPLADEETRTQVPYNDALYQKAQVEYFMDSLKNSFIDFQRLVNNNYEEKSNCILWQGTIYTRYGEAEKACTYFYKAKQAALNDGDREEADKMIKTYCGQQNEKH